VEKNIKQLRKQLIIKNVTLTITNSAKQWFGKEGYDRVMGARPMERLIEDKLKKPLAEELLFGRFSSEGGEVRIILENGILQIQAINQSEIIANQQPAVTDPENA